MAKGETITDPSRRIYIDPEPCVGVKKAVIPTYPQRPDCVAGHVRLELRNVVAKYPFERSHRFPVIQPNSGRRDYSRLSCGLGRDACAGVGHSLR